MICILAKKRRVNSELSFSDRDLIEAEDYPQQTCPANYESCREATAPFVIPGHRTDFKTKEKRELLTLFFTGAGDRKFIPSKDRVSNDLLEH